MAFGRVKTAVGEKYSPKTRKNIGIKKRDVKNIADLKNLPIWEKVVLVKTSVTMKNSYDEKDDKKPRTLPKIVDITKMMILSPRPDGRA